MNVAKQIASGLLEARGMFRRAVRDTLGRQERESLTPPWRKVRKDFEPTTIVLITGYQVCCCTSEVGNRKYVTAAEWARLRELIVPRLVARRYVEMCHDAVDDWYRIARERPDDVGTMVADTAATGMVGNAWHLYADPVAKLAMLAALAYAIKCLTVLAQMRIAGVFLDEARVKELAGQVS